jgi:hypothetical protein
MSIEAMKQALEALKYHMEQTRPINMTQNAIHALRQAIEQAEKQEPVAWMVRDSIDGSWYPCAFENPAGAIKGESKPLYAVPQQAEKQEPIAWMVYTLDGASAFVTDNPNNFTEFHSCFALYTAPPPRKEWVGLTEDEIRGIFDCGRGGLVDIKKAEQILKEKNGGN